MALAALGFAGWVFSGYGGAPAEAVLTAAQAAVRPEPRPPPPAPAALQVRLEEIAKAYGEPVGVAVTDVTERWTASVDGTGSYPQQSVAKIWVAVAALDAIDRGLLRLDQPVLLTQQDRSVFYQPLGARIGTQGFSTTVGDLLRLAITESDNAANDRLIREAGGVEGVTAVMLEKGLRDMSVGDYQRQLQSQIAGVVWRPEYAGWRFKEARAALSDDTRTQALDAYLAAPLDGATPIAVAHGLAALQRGELLSAGSTRVLLDLLAQAKTGPRRLKAGLPAGWLIGHKTGTGPDWRGGSVGINDVGLLTAPDGRVYAVAVMIRETRQPVSARVRMMQSVSRAVADHWAHKDAPTVVARVNGKLGS